MNLIPLQDAYARQSKDVDDNEWIIYSSDDVELGRLPSSLTPKEAMSYLHFGRKFEIGALDAGIKFGIRQEQEKTNKVFQKMREQILGLETQNIGLSAHLEKLIIGA